MVKKKSLMARIWDRISFAEDESVQNEQYDRTLVLHRDPIGSSGTRSSAGYPYEDYLQKLRGKERADIFDQMRRSDPQAKMCLSAVKNPIRSAVWQIEPGDQTDEAKSDAEFIEHILFNDMDQPWNNFIDEALTYVDFGHAIFELTHKIVFNHAKFGTYNGIRSLGWRSPRTIERWNLNRENGKLISISQYAYGDLQRLVDIPAEFLIVFSLEKEGSNYEGISLLRPCYGNWFRKNTYLKLNAIGIEKFAIPTPIVTVPSGMQNQESYGALVSALEAYVTHEKGYLTIPEGWELDLKTSTYDPEKVEVSIDNEDKRMVKSFLANFLELGMNGTGAYALSNDLSDFFLSGLDYIANGISETINMDLIPNLIKLNRGARDKYPRLKVSGVSDKAGKELADTLKAYADGKLITPDEKLEENLRMRYKLPKSDPLTARQVQPVFNAAPPTLAEKIKLAEARRLKVLRDGKS